MLSPKMAPHLHLTRIRLLFASQPDWPHLLMFGTFMAMEPCTMVWEELELPSSKNPMMIVKQACNENILKLTAAEIVIRDQ